MEGGCRSCGAVNTHAGDPVKGGDACQSVLIHNGRHAVTHSMLGLSDSLWSRAFQQCTDWPCARWTVHVWGGVVVTQRAAMVACP